MFTDPEARIVKGALEGAVAFTHGSSALGTALGAGLTRSTRAAFVTAFTQVARASRDVMGGALGLLGAMPQDKAEGTRAEQLEWAWSRHIQRAADDSLPAAMEAVAVVAPEAASLIAGADGALRAINRATLLHSDPPPGATLGGRRTIIGPHADYFRAAHFGWTATHYMDDWAQEGFIPVLTTCARKVRGAMAESWRLYAWLARLQVQAMALNAGIPLHSSWENLPVLQGSRQFAHALAALGLLQRAVDVTEGDGIPEAFAAHGNAWLEVLPGVKPAQIPAWVQGFRRQFDAWKRENQEAWMCNFFPDRRAG